ncbi:MAG: hypothetical protein O7G88_02415 [bacterium]|nr:hypothetical protein [bacterium]
MLTLLQQSPKPTIAAVKGFTLGGNQLNQLLRLASQSRVVHSQSDDVKSALKATMQQADPSQGLKTED